MRTTDEHGVGPGDIDVREFARLLQTLEPHLPISDSFERDFPQRRGAWWASQQEHMVHWFLAQSTLGSGAFVRQVPNLSSRTTYNRLLAPAAFLWMAEALGEGTQIVQSASESARAEPNARKRPGILRTHLPWTRIAQLARGRALRHRRV